VVMMDRPLGEGDTTPPERSGAQAGA